MIVQATEKDRERILKYVNDKPCENLFISGDITQYGFDNDFQTVWIDENNEQIKGVYLLFKKNLCIYMHNLDGNFKELTKLIESHEILVINALRPLAEKLFPYVPNYKLRHTNIAVCNSKDKLVNLNLVEKAKEEDIEQLTKLRMLCFPENSNKTFESQYESVKMVLNDFGIYMIKEKDRIVSMAYSNSQSNAAGMICSVCTCPDSRNKGYGTQVVSAVVDDLLSKGKIACLFFDNPAAASIYHKLGFEDINQYTMMIAE